MIPPETTDHFISLSKKLESELIETHDIKEEYHPPGSGHENVMQRADASDYIDLSDWDSRTDEDKRLNENILLAQIREKVKSSLEEAKGKWPDIKFFRLNVNWMNIPDAVSNPLETIGRFMVLAQGVK